LILIVLSPFITPRVVKSYPLLSSNKKTATRNHKLFVKSSIRIF